MCSLMFFLFRTKLQKQQVVLGTRFILDGGGGCVAGIGLGVLRL